MARSELRSGPVRVGLLGCGRISRMFHLEILQRLDGCTLAALADTDPARLAEAAAAAPGAARFGSYGELLEQADIDAVVVALPTAHHGDAAFAALELGKHVYVEKPLAATMSEAENIVAAWRRAGTAGAMGYVFRFHPLYRALRDAIASGAVGETVAVRTSFASAARDLPAWKRSRATGGGALIDLASHHIDLLRFLFGREIVEAGALVRTVVTEDDTALVELVLEGGLAVQTIASASAVQEDRIEIYGVDGKLVADRFRARRVEVVPVSVSRSGRGRLVAGSKRARAAVGDLRATLTPAGEPSFEAALRAFVAAARGAALEGADLEDGYRALLVVHAAEDAARTGRRMPVVLASG
jgi:myo-inositol 2-dehydrogenase / D-chiro-inositol 1-dehydrogenase